MYLTRRPSLKLLLASCLAVGIATQAVATWAADGGLIETVKAVEARLGGRVGVAIYDDESGKSWAYRAEQRFPISSTFKAYACGAVLARVDAGREDLARVVTFEEKDLVTYSPVTENRVGPDGMSMSEICEAAVTVSDNTAGNLIIESLGDPSGFTTFMRSIGDPATRLDRWETELNEGVPGDPRDTTTPKAAADSLRALLLGDVLSTGSRARLTGWMLNDKVADALFRSVVPDGWRVADKTGAGGSGSRSLIAVMWPPERKPIIAAVYMTENDAEFSDRNAAIAEIGQAIVKTVSE